MHDTKQVTNPDGFGCGRLWRTAVEKWKSGGLPIEPGRHENLVVFEGETHMENAHGMTVPVKAPLSITVQRQLDDRLLPITKVTGFKDEIGGDILTKGFDVGVVSPAETAEKWEKVQSEDCDQRPAIGIRGLSVRDEKGPTEQSVGRWVDPTEFQHLQWGGRQRYRSYEDVRRYPRRP